MNNYNKQLDKYDLTSSEILKILNAMTSDKTNGQLQQDYDIKISTLMQWSKLKEYENGFWRKIYYEYLKRYDKDLECDYTKFKINDEVDVSKNRSLFELGHDEFSGLENSAKDFKKKLSELICDTPTFILTIRLSYIRNIINNQNYLEEKTAV